MLCVIIPIYKTILSDDEVVSLKQCFKILGNHTIKLVAPMGLDIIFYERVLKQKIEIEYFDANYFKDIRGYNQLMLSVEFYKRFIDFKYMLIHQLDCYVFKDELLYWTNLNYDYIGAPWLDYNFYNMSKSKKAFFLLKRYIKIKLGFNLLFDKSILVNNVGNGGFSLRRVKKFIEVLSIEDIIKLNKFQSNETSSIFNEDIYWSFVAKGVKKASYKEAARFSLDLNADIGMRLNKGKLPFGCHAWNKKKNFWEKYIN